MAYGSGVEEAVHHMLSPDSMTVHFMDRLWSPAELIVTLLCVTVLTLWLRRNWKEAAAGFKAKKAWLPTAYLIILDPEILVFALLSFAFSVLPFALLYFAGAAPKTNGALAWIGWLLGSKQETMTLPPLSLEVIFIALSLVAAFGLCFIISVAGARIMNFGAVYTAHKRISGGSPNIIEASLIVLKRLPDIIRVLLDFRRSAGVEGAFVPQYLMCHGEEPQAALEHSALRASQAGGRASFIWYGIRFAPVRTATELSRALAIGFIPAWLLSFYITFGFLPADSLPWTIFGLFGTILGYMLACLNLLSFINSVFLTAVFSNTGDSAGSPLLANYAPRHLTAPFA